MTANDALRMLQSEGIFHVLAAQFDALLSLAAVKTYAFQHFVSMGMCVICATPSAISRL